MSIVSEFKAFIQRGNVIELAVGIIIGAAFGKVVSSLVNDVLMPPIGAVLGGVDFTDKKIPLGSEPGSATLKYGSFIQAIIDFGIIAFCVFVLVKVVNRLQGPKDSKPKEPSDEVKLLTEIRDLLKK